jgi:hypothetical protein
MLSLRDCSETKKIDIHFVYLFSLNIVLVISFAMLSPWLGLDLLDSGQFNAPDFKSEIVIFFIAAVIIFPFFEELIHRSYVSKRINSLWSILFLMIYFAVLSDFSSSKIFIFSLYFIFLISIIVFDNLYHNKFYLLINTSMFFAIFHVFKFSDFQSETIVVLLLSLFPQLVSGVILFFIHKKYGFFVGVIYHGLINGVLLGVIYMGISLIEKEMSASLIAD